MLFRQKGDLVRGVDTFFNAAKMWLDAVRLLVAGSLIVFVIAMGLVLWRNTIADDLKVTALWYAAQVAVSRFDWDMPISFDYGAQKIESTARRFVVHRGALGIRDAVLSEMENAARTGVWAAGSTFIIFGFAAARRGRSLREERFLRGGKVATDPELARYLRKQGKASDLTIGRVPIVKGSETGHAAYVGSTSTGKSQYLAAWVRQVRRRGDAAVIYDSTGFFVSRFFRSGDIILSAADDRCPYWDLWAEIRRPEDAIRLANALIALLANSASDPFWIQSAQQLLAGAILAMRDDPDRSITKLIRVLIEPDFRALATLLKDAPIAAAFAGDVGADNKFAQSIRGTLLPAITALKFLTVDKTRPTFCIREFLERVERMEGERPIVFISSRADNHDAQRPIISMWLDTFVASLMALGPRADRRFHFVIDELPNLNRLPSLKRLFAEGRQFGAACAIGIQDIALVRAIYGRDEADAILNQCNTHVILRLNDDEQAQWASRLLGARDIELPAESLTYSGKDSRDGVHLSSQRRTEAIVTATQVQQLDKLECYVKLAGPYPIARTRITYIDYKILAPAYVEIDPNKTGWAKTQASGSPPDNAGTISFE